MNAPQRRPRIALLSFYDARDKRSWSGTPYYTAQALQRHVGDVVYLGPVKVPYWLDKTLRGIAKGFRLLTGTEYQPKYSTLLARYAGRYLSRRLKEAGPVDYVFAPASAPEIAYLKTDLPIVYFGDSTYRCYSETYTLKEFKDLNGISRREGNYMEGIALRRSRLIIMSSDWAVDSAVKDYGIDPGKVKMHALGANMDELPPRSGIHAKESVEGLTLLFLAVDWERKGGDIALQALESLHQRGIQARLIVCGCTPPDGRTHPFMEVIPFLNKNLAADHDRFVALLSSVHFLILPTRADCNLLVACEANAYGVPAITTRTCGVPAVVEDGVNGYCLPLEADGTAYAALIAEIFRDKDRYSRLVESSRQRFEEVLNWDAWAEWYKEIARPYLPAAAAAPEEAPASSGRTASMAR